jgi:phosphate transport system permease protein
MSAGPWHRYGSTATACQPPITVHRGLPPLASPEGAENRRHNSMSQLKTLSSRWARRYDWLARWVITLGGLAVIASVIAILAMIVGTTLPLLRSPQAELVCTSPLPQAMVGDETAGLGVELGIHGSQITGFIWSKSGALAILDLRTGQLLQRHNFSPNATDHGALRQAESLGAGVCSLLWSDGATLLVEISHKAATADRPSHLNAPYAVETLASIPASKGERPRQVLARRAASGTITRTALLREGAISILRQTSAEDLLGEQHTSGNQSLLSGDTISRINVMTLDREGNTLYAGTNDGYLAYWHLNENGEAANRQVVRAFADKRAITALAMVLGDVSLAVGDAQGGLTVWFPVNADGGRKLRLIHQLSSHKGAVREILPSSRSRTILSLGEDGTVHLDHVTSGQRLLSIGGQPGQPLRQLAFSARGDALLGLDSTGVLRTWLIDDGYPEISFKTLFGKVHYEGYDSPQYVWQTTGGEEFEPKYSLVPLLFGTLKGTFYAMLLAAPISLFGAVYVSYFTTPAFRRLIKPLVEIMATLPSVVIGFLIALWLAPIIERWIVALLAGFITLPAAFVAFLLVWQLLRRWHWAKLLENGYEFLVLMPVLVAGVAVAMALAKPLETWLFDGNFRQWLFDGPLGMRYDQRNCIIIAFGLGFTVMPIIFSIAEDSLSNVPYNMTAASMALGASRWQTLWRVVLPSASPGIFAAMMIGFGRAVGETMIVLMATGNTPIIDFSPLNGMRTLSANIAVEVSEAPVGGTLYRVLFLCAVLLFLLTFVLNTAAELVRQHLRNRFGKY